MNMKSNTELMVSIRQALANLDVEQMRELLKEACANNDSIEDEYLIDQLGTLAGLTAQNIYCKEQPNVVYEIVDLMIEFGVSWTSIYCYPKAVALNYLKAKTPSAAVKGLPFERKQLLPLALRLYFESSSMTPDKYLKKCPEWHKPYIQAFIE